MECKLLTESGLIGRYPYLYVGVQSVYRLVESSVDCAHRNID